VTEIATVFPNASGPSTPKLEFVFQIRLKFTRVQNIPNMPSGAGRGAVYLDEGVIEGPRLQGRAVSNSGGDYALFRPDGVLQFDARYMLEASDGGLILLYNKGYLWGRTPDVMPRIRKWIFEGGEPVPFEEYYLRANPTFETSAGPHDWLMRHVIIGVGERMTDGNLLRYFVIT
jgi:hypothetical protein